MRTMASPFRKKYFLEKLFELSIPSIKQLRVCLERIKKVSNRDSNEGTTDHCCGICPDPPTQSIILMFFFCRVTSNKWWNQNRSSHLSPKIFNICEYKQKFKFIITYSGKCLDDFSNCN